jgi:glycosyltransferase involved in cell wall biosynthesis
MGTFIWHKGVHVLIKAFKMVENKKIKLKIFGRGDERDPYVKELVNLAKNDDRIEFCGTFDYSELPEIMAGISIIVIPSSYKENFPLVMQNSLAYHKPVIASNVGGMPEVIKDDVNGFLFEQENEEQLARIIHKISQNPEIIKRLKNGIKLPPRIEGEALHYENIYRNLLKKKTIP